MDYLVWQIGRVSHIMLSNLYRAETTAVSSVRDANL